METFGLAPLCMTGHEEKLFCKHMNFSTARHDMTNPTMGASKIITEYVEIDYSAKFVSFVARLSAVLQVMSTIKSSTTPDVEVLETVLRCFVPIPPLSYKEIYLEHGSKNNLVGGKIDLLVGSGSNGGKPKLRVVGKSRDSM